MIKKGNGYSYPKVWTHTPAVVSQSGMERYSTMDLPTRIPIDQTRRDSIRIQGDPYGTVIIRIHPTYIIGRKNKKASTWSR